MYMYLCGGVVKYILTRKGGSESRAPQESDRYPTDFSPFLGRLCLRLVFFYLFFSLFLRSDFIRTSLSDLRLEGNWRVKSDIPMRDTRETQKTLSDLKKFEFFLGMSDLNFFWQILLSDIRSGRLGHVGQRYSSSKRSGYA